MKIHGIEGISEEEMDELLKKGAKFVVFEYVISVIFLTMTRTSDVYFIRPGEIGGLKGVLFTLISLILGWWGLPWGPIHTIRTVFRNLDGGKDVTQKILDS